MIKLMNYNFTQMVVKLFLTNYLKQNSSYLGWWLFNIKSLGSRS